MKLHRLNVCAFRGATRPFVLEFDPEKRITMIYGENGSGKSTIADALTCLCTDSLGSLKDKTGTDSADLLSLGSQAADLSIGLQTDEGHWKAVFSAKKMHKTPQQGLPTLRAIRRQHIVDLANAAPAERYKYLKAYIDVDGVTQSEDRLRVLVKNLETALSNEKNFLARAELSLKEAWEKEGRPFGNWQDWAGEAALRDLAAETERLQALQNALQRWQRMVEAASQHHTNLLAAHKAQASLADSVAQRQALTEQSPSQNPALLAVLEQARQYLSQSHSATHCPVCSQSIEKVALSAAISKQIESMESMSVATRMLESAQREQQAADAIAGKSRADFQQNFEDFKASLRQINPYSDAWAGFLEIPSAAAAYQARPWPTLATVISELEQQAYQISVALSQHNLIQAQWQAVCASYVEAEQLSTSLAAAKQALHIVESARKSFVESELNAVSADVDALYANLHPGEPLGGISLFIKEKVRGSVEMSARFHGQQVAPQAFYSESHLDTLAFCLLFALAKRYGDPTTILLLDDVLAACDESHLDRFTQLLQAQAEHFAHILLTTHYQPWRERFGKNDTQNGGIHFIELMPWSLEDGIRVNL